MDLASGCLESGLGIFGGGLKCFLGVFGLSTEFSGLVLAARSCSWMLFGNLGQFGIDLGNRVRVVRWLWPTVPNILLSTSIYTFYYYLGFILNI